MENIAKDFPKRVNWQTQSIEVRMRYWESLSSLHSQNRMQHWQVKAKRREGETESNVWAFWHWYSAEQTCSREAKYFALQIFFRHQKPTYLSIFIPKVKTGLLVFNHMVLKLEAHLIRLAGFNWRLCSCWSCQLSHRKSQLTTGIATWHLPVSWICTSRLLVILVDHFLST